MTTGRTLPAPTRGHRRQPGVPSGSRSGSRSPGNALLGTLIMSLAVAVVTATYLSLSFSEVKKARIPTCRTRALYDALGELARARLLVTRSRYDAAGDNLVLASAAGSTIPGTSVTVTPVDDDPTDAQVPYFLLEARGEFEDVEVRVRQLVAARESFASFFSFVGEDNLGIGGIEDEDYDPTYPPALPPMALSRGKVHTNRQIELCYSGHRHFVHPISGAVPGGGWLYKDGAEQGKQKFWYEDESRPDAAPITLPDAASYGAVRDRLVEAAQPVDFPDDWADGLVTVNDHGYHIQGDVDVLAAFDGPAGSFALTLRERSGARRTSTLSGLVLPASDCTLFAENGYDPDAPPPSPNQTVHLKGDVNHRLTVFVPTGDARIAGSLRAVDDEGRPAASLRDDGTYGPNPAYDGNAAIGIIAEFDVRLGIKPTTPYWPDTQCHIDAATASWVYTGAPGLAGQPVGPRGEYLPEDENLFGYLGGPTGNDPAEIHGALLARQGRVYADGMNPLGHDSTYWGFRVGYRSSQLVAPYGRASAALYRYGSTISSRRPVTNLVDGDGETLVGWGMGQNTYDEELALNPPPYFFRHNEPVFYEIQVLDPARGVTAQIGGTP